MKMMTPKHFKHSMNNLLHNINKQLLHIVILFVLAVSGTYAEDNPPTMNDVDHSNILMQNNTMPPAEKSKDMQNRQHDSMSGMNHGTMHEQQTLGTMNHSQMNSMSHGSMPMSDSSMNGMSDMRHGNMQGGSAPKNARDPHAYSNGYTLESGPYVLPRPRQIRMADEHNFGLFLLDRLEAVHTTDNDFVAYDLKAWYGRTYNRAVLKAEGIYDNKTIEESSTELLWAHAVAIFWNTQLGLRYDSGEDGDRTWLAFGIEGLARYWFDLEITGYIDEQGHTALNLQSEYDILFTQRLILQPRLEADVYGKDDRKRGIGSGLSELKAGLRLRYEFQRQIAPYAGIEWSGKFAGTADYARDAGLNTNDTQFVAGLRMWF